MRISKTDNTNFRASHIADAVTQINGISNGFKLYKLSKEDEPFLKCLYGATDLKKLMPGLSDIEYDIWNSTFCGAVNHATSAKKNSFLIANENKACGLGVCSVWMKNTYKVDYVCTWPVEPGKRVPLAGKILFRPLFDNFMESESRIMELNALKLGPFSAVSKYLQLGFGMYGGTDYSELMRATRVSVQKTIDKLDKMMKYTRIDGGPVADVADYTGRKVDLFKELYI